MRRSGGKEIVDALALISFPHQILHALAAIRFDAEETGGLPPSRKAFFLWSHQPAHHREGSSFSDFCRRALSDEGRVIFPKYVSRICAFSPYRRIKARASSIAALPLKALTFYFAHDQSADHMAQAFLQSGIATRAVCFGDPPGFFYPAQWTSPWSGKKLGTKLKNELWRTRIKGLETWIEPDAACAAIPLGHGSESVRRIPRRHFLEVVDLLNARLPEIGESISVLPGKTLFLLTSNFYESGLMTRESECQLYSEIARTSIKEGETLVVRPHPGASDASIAMLKGKLSDMPIRFFPDSLRSHPIELFPNAMRGTRIASVSSSMMMLRFLYDVEVEPSLTEERVNRFFRPEYRTYGLEMVKAFRSPLPLGSDS